MTLRLKMIPAEGDTERKYQLRIIQHNLLAQYNHMYDELTTLQHKPKAPPFKLNKNVLQNIHEQNQLIHKMCKRLKQYILTLHIGDSKRTEMLKHVDTLQSGLFLYMLHTILYTHYKFHHYDQYNCLLNEGNIGRNCANTSIIVYLYALSFPEYRIQFCLTEHHMAIGISVQNKITYVMDYGNHPYLSNRCTYPNEFYDYIQDILQYSEMYLNMYNSFATMLNDAQNTHEPFICNRTYDVRRNYIIASNQLHSPLVRYAISRGIWDIFPTLLYFNKTLLGDDRTLSQIDDMSVIYPLYTLYKKITTILVSHSLDPPQYRKELTKFVKLFNQTFVVHFTTEYIVNMIFFTRLNDERRKFIESSSSSHDDDIIPIQSSIPHNPSKRARQAISAARKRLMDRDDRPDATKNPKS